MRLGADLPSSPRKKLQVEGLGWVPAPRRVKVGPWVCCSRESEFVPFPASTMFSSPPPHSSMLNKSLPRQV